MYIPCTTTLVVDLQFWIPRLPSREEVSTDIFVRSLTFLSYLALTSFMSPLLVTIPILGSTEVDDTCVNPDLLYNLHNDTLQIVF